MWATVRAWKGSARPGRCKHCKRAIIWMISDAGKYHPFDLGFTVREEVVEPKTRARYLVLHRDDLHDCAAGRLARREARGRREVRGQSDPNRSHRRQ